MAMLFKRLLSGISTCASN